MSKYDLTTKIGSNLDRHLVFPLLEFLGQKELYPEGEILQSKLELLSKTGMVDFYGDIWKKLNNSAELPEDIRQKRNEVVGSLKSLQEAAKPLLTLLEDELKASKGAGFLQQHHITNECLNALYQYARRQFDCGNYSAAAEYMANFRLLSTDQAMVASALWGKVAAEILMQHWDTAWEDLVLLRDQIDGKQAPSHIKQLHQRTWLLHWGLFVFFNHPKGRAAFIDLCFQDRYMSAIQTTSPYLLRYLTVAIVTTRPKRIIKELIKLLQQEAYTQTDPVTAFVEELLVNFDFTATQERLKEVSVLLSNDFFLVACRDEFVENSRLMIFETFCKIHSKFLISDLSEKLNFTPEEGEKWILNTLKNYSSSINASFNEETRTVTIVDSRPSVYQQLLDKTKEISERSQALVQNVQKTTAKAH